MAVPVAAGAAAAAQMIPALIGRGKSNYNAQDISHSQMYDPFAYQIGSYGAENYKEGREQQARAIDQRQAPQANYMQADLDRQRALQARASQATVMGQLMARAAGQTPSIAGMQAQQDAQRAVAQQASLAASARGGASLANAQTQAANNTANAQANISNSAQINAANERLQAEQAAFGAASGMRGQDYQSQGQAAQQAQYQAGLQMANRQTNDARALGTQQMGHAALMGEQQGRVAMQGIAAQSHASAQRTNAETASHDADSKGIIESVGDFFSDVNTKAPLQITSDFAAKFGFGGTGGDVGGESNESTVMSGGGMDVGATQRKFSAQAQGGGMDGESSDMSGLGGLLSDDRTKLAAAWDEGHKAALGDVAKRGGKDLARAIQVDRATEDQMRVNAKRSGKPADPASREGVRAATEASMQRRNALVDSRPVSGGEIGQAARPVVADRYAEPIQPLTEEERRQQPWYRGEPAPPPPQQQPHEQGIITRIGSFFESDFRAKEGLGGTPEWQQADPEQGQFRYVPGRGWIAPDDERKRQLDSAMEEQATQDREDVEWADKVRKNDARLAQQAEWQRAADEEDEPMATGPNGKPVHMAPGTADFQKTQPKPQADGEQMPWWMALGNAAKGLNEAQFGSRMRSDRRAKNVVDLDEVDVDNDEGGQDFDADEYTESKFPKPYEREGSTARHDTKAEAARIKRAGEDKAGRDADEMMGGYEASLGRGASVRVPDQRVPMRTRNPSEGPYVDPDGNAAGDEDFNTYDEDSIEARALRPSHSPVAQANRTMVGQPYTYKPQFTPPEQKPGEPNFGFMAQNLEKSPITATAVKEDPNGLKRVDALKLLRILGASVADLQRQQDDTRLALAKGGRG